MQKLFIFTLLHFFVGFPQILQAQCEATVSGSPNWSALTWSGCSPNPVTDGST